VSAESPTRIVLVEHTEQASVHIERHGSYFFVSTASDARDEPASVLLNAADMRRLATWILAALAMACGTPSPTAPPLRPIVAPPTFRPPVLPLDTATIQPE
jgi:hypothetical protein